jgi:hypothetical protein
MEMAARAAFAPAACSGSGVCRAARRQHPAARGANSYLVE